MLHFLTGIEAVLESTCELQCLTFIPHISKKKKTFSNLHISTPLRKHDPTRTETS